MRDTARTYRAIVVVVGLILMASCTAQQPLDLTKPINDVYVTKMALTQTYNALTVGILTKTITVEMATAAAPKLQQVEVALAIAESASTAADRGSYLAAAKQMLDDARHLLGLPPALAAPGPGA